MTSTIPNNPGPFPYNPSFNVSAVLDLARSLSSHSWECGTASEVLFELFDPVLAVYTHHPAEKLPCSYAQEKIVIGAPPNG